MDFGGHHHGRGGHRGRGGRGGHHGHGHHGHHGGPPGPGHHGPGHHGHHGHHKKHHGPGGHHGFGPESGHFPPPYHGPGGKGHWGPPKHEMFEYEQYKQQPMEYVKPQEGNVQVDQKAQEPVKQYAPVLEKQQTVVTQNNTEDQFMCGICESEKKNSFFEPCMHLYACEACAKLILEKDKRCPICMKSISGMKKIFIA